MRVLVTGAGNPFGSAIVKALLADGHTVRMFGDDDSVAAAHNEAHWFPGRVEVGGQIEPALSEREVLVHAACLDAPGKDKHAHAVHIERGTLYARYGAEREQVDHFIHVTPTKGGRFQKAQENAVTTVKATRGTIHVHVVPADDPTTAARAVVAALQAKPAWGKQPGRENDAVTA